MNYKDILIDGQNAVDFAKNKIFLISDLVQEIEYLEREIKPLRDFLDNKKIKAIRVTFDVMDKNMIGFNIKPSISITKRYVKRILISYQRKKRKKELELEKAMFEVKNFKKL